MRKNIMVNHASCLICGISFEARTSYGLCSSCISKDKLREFDRWHSAIRQAEKMNVPADLSLLQWMATLSDHRGMCSMCQIMPGTVIEPINQFAGLSWNNVVPMCRSCSYVKRTGFGTLLQRVLKYLLANEGRDESSINLEYLYEPEDGPDLIAPVETP